MTSVAPVARRVVDCRVCGSADLIPFLSLGEQPPANRFLTEAQLSSPEPTYPLEVAVCRSCRLVQLLHVVPKEFLFADYPYFSSMTRTIPEHFRKLALELHAGFVDSPDNLVVEIGSNDGVLLTAFHEKGARVLGIEPAENVAAVARERGVDTWCRFMDRGVAREIRSAKGPARLVIANNVLAHIDDVRSVLEGVRELLEPKGAFVFEVPYLVDLLEHTEYDTIYHEHLSYFAIGPLQTLLSSAGLKIREVTRQEVHGGTLRVLAQPSAGTGGGAPGRSVIDLLRLEERSKLGSMEPYEGFAAAVRANRTDLLDTLRRLKRAGERVVGYGAPAKGNTLLNYCGIGTEHLGYIQDTTPAKQGRYTPGTHIPVVPPEEFQRDRPDVALLLAWNYEREVVGKEQSFLRRGGRFLIPIPKPREVAGGEPAKESRE